MIAWVIRIQTEGEVEGKELLCFFQFTISFFFFGPHHEACGILVPGPGIEPRLSAMRVRSPNHWTAREFLVFSNLNDAFFSSALTLL